MMRFKNVWWYKLNLALDISDRKIILQIDHKWLGAFSHLDVCLHTLDYSYVTKQKKCRNGLQLHKIMVQRYLDSDDDDRSQIRHKSTLNFLNRKGGQCVMRRSIKEFTCYSFLLCKFQKRRKIKYFKIYLEQIWLRKIITW